MHGYMTNKFLNYFFNLYLKTDTLIHKAYVGQFLVVIASLLTQIFEFVFKN